MHEPTLHLAQVFLPLDVSRGDVWRVRVMSGSNAGEEVWLQRNMIEEYTAPIIYKPIKKVYSFISDLGRCGETLKLHYSIT